MRVPIETLMLVEMEGYEEFYSFKTKGPGYDKRPTINIGSQEIPNTKTLYFDSNLVENEEFRVFMRDAYRQDRFIKINRTVVTDNIILAKFELVYALFTEKSIASITLEKLIKLIESNTDVSKVQAVTDKLNELVEELA